MSIEYDPATCITAGELRQMGWTIPGTIPDVGWVPRGSLTFGPVELKAGERGEIRASVACGFSEPFQWITVDFEVTPAD